ncbi:flagellar protein FlgJ [Granulicella tundricola]|uniref:Flagellar protein FlgJ-like protein n=1 Tax=Granulicella tundricola (strain ATCC BAA-1859 / DSM 23138 / MP5ACTX9) TaxID=1198114 RepID=E8X3V2_GRATM|nr:flagellar protein FlgJ [Granulicella tundricola]ADW69380.1 flagellar protein FlgJ-like protein [Granulicella tundricola MP5ACTX9]
MRIDDVVAVQAGAKNTLPNPKLVDGAKDFEAMMLKEMLKPLHFGATDDGANGDSEKGGEADTIQGFALDALGKGLTRGGGFGLAKQIIRQVTAEQSARQSKRVTGHD